jgi:hypothetical protein
MKKQIFTCALFIFFLSVINAQEINTLSNGINIKKGTIVLDDGVKKQFQNMTVEGLNLTYYDLQNQKYNSDLSSVYTITKYMNYVPKGAIWGAASGVLIGFAWESINTTDPTFQPLHYFRTSAIIGGAICCGVGALLGKLRSKEKVCYKNQANFKPSIGLNFVPINNDLRSKHYPELCLKLNF